MLSRVLYSDTVSLVEDVIHIATREGSIEINRYNNTFYGHRVNIDGCWSIVSSNNKYDRALLEKLRQHTLSISLSNCGELAEAELYVGQIEIGKEPLDIDEVVKLVHDLCVESKGYSIAKCEIVVNFKTIDRTIERADNSVAHERRHIMEVDIGLMGRSGYGSTSFASNYGALILWNPKEVTKYIESLFKATRDKILKTHNLRPLKPYLYGRATIVLDHVASAALFHEISHLLDASYDHGYRLLEQKLCSDEVEVYDEPHNAEAPSIRFFDDEGVITRKRVLIENGVVRGLHHTRTTAKITGSEPGSAYGLFHKPIPFHTTLAVKPRDWKYEEILEDTKRGFYISGIAMATLEEGFIRIVPELGYAIDDGELREVVRIREVKIPMGGLKTISAISRDAKIRTSYERSWIISEISPMIRLEAYVQ